MNKYLINRFVKEAMMSANPGVAQQANLVNDTLMNQQEEDVVLDADIVRNENPEFQVKNKLEDIDQMLHNVMPEIVEETRVDPSNPTETKTASAYIKDLKLSDVPGLNAADLARFGNGGKGVEVVLYGMVVKELLNKVDKHNFDVAMAHVKKDWEGKDLADLKDEVYKQAKTKYVLCLNDQIIDGHHFLAKAKFVGLTSSINVIDLTPIRFQKTAMAKPSTLWDSLQTHYGKPHHSWQNPFEKRSAGRVSAVRGNTRAG